MRLQVPPEIFLVQSFYSVPYSEALIPYLGSSRNLVSNLVSLLNCMPS